jgi:hypothetical protein
MESTTMFVFSIQLRALMSLIVESKGEKRGSPVGLDVAVHDACALTEGVTNRFKVSMFRRVV